MRVWTRQYQPDGTQQWKPVNDKQGSIAWLQNALLLQLGESHFWNDWGLPVTQNIVTQIWPDYYVNMTQNRFSDYFASLRITHDSQSTEDNPIYHVAAIFPDGTTYQSGKKSFNQSFSQTGPFHGSN